MMQRAPFVTLVQVIIVLATASGQNPCDPICTIGDSYVIDPRDCSQYFYCYPDLTLAPTPEKCPPGLFFNPWSMRCDTISCFLICGQCHLTCDPNLLYDVIADVYNCNIFYDCDNGVPGGFHECPGDKPYFDGTTLTCVNNLTACCNPGCIPRCEPGNLHAPDPTDCNRYYLCIQDEPQILLSCPAGEVFDIGSGHCNAGAVCTEWCGLDKKLSFSLSSPTPTPSKL